MTAESIEKINEPHHSIELHDLVSTKNAGRDPLLNSILVFLKLKQFKYLNNLLKEKEVDICKDNHYLLRAVGSSNPSKKTLEWILEKGDYVNKHPQIALCILSQCNEVEKVEKILESGIDPDQPPWEGAESAIEFAIEGDAGECVQSLCNTIPANKLDFLIRKASHGARASATIALLNQIKTKTQSADTCWQIWEKNSEFPTEVAQALAPKLSSNFIKTLLNKNSPKTREEDSYHLQTLKKEKHKRQFRKKVSENSKSLSLDNE